jgi:mono/diheme cytochrome c family protein
MAARQSTPFRARARTRSRVYWCVRCLAALALLISPRLTRADDPPPPNHQEVDFERDIRPIFVARCLECHGPEKQRGGLRLDSFESIGRGGTSGEVIVPGASGDSLLIEHVESTDSAFRMPPKGDPLTKEQIHTIRAWIDQSREKLIAKSALSTSSEVWWSLRPLKSPAVPGDMEDSRAYSSSAIDAFILQALRDNELHPAPEADRRTLIRRLSLDLTGLPPNSEETDRFVEDTRPTAYTRLVDRLLASPRLGERWARHWLDVAHYADSHGQDQDRPRPNAWPYRDYLIRAFNRDTPYSRFVREQVAGDVIDPENPEAIIATGFLAAGPWDESGLRDIREDSIDRLIAQYLDRDDIVTSTMSTFMGLTVGCARCHDHKFDPITQRDYYALQAVFAGIDKAERAFDRDPATARKRAELVSRLDRLKHTHGFLELAMFSQARKAAVERFLSNRAAASNPWVTPDPVSPRSAKGTILKALLDRSILAIGPNPDLDTYTIELDVGSTRVTALRLELLPDESLPSQGPGRAENGSLHLSELRIASRTSKDAPSTPMKVATAWSDFDQAGFSIDRAIDGDPKTAWGIHPQTARAHEAVVVLESPQSFGPGARLIVELDQQHGAKHVLGRFRLSVTTRAPTEDPVQPLTGELANLLANPRASRSFSDQVAINRLLWQRETEIELASLPPLVRAYCGTNQFRADGTFRPAPAPRTVHILGRGEIARPGEEAAPGALPCVPGPIPQFEISDQAKEGERRIALARWLAHGENPLAWRVMVNRLWQHHFGRGLVNTPNDFG